MALYCVIVNEAAGNGRALKIWQHTKDTLQQKGIHYRVRFTKYSNHATEFTHDIVHRQEAKAIVAIGGDGTIHEVINGLVGSSIPLGIIPAGSGNDFCRGMRIPLNYDEALKRILMDEQKVVDVGHINDKYFATIAGLGFDGQVAQESNKPKNKIIMNAIRIGSIPYIINVLKVLLYYKPTSVELHIDSHRTSHQKVWLIAIANSPFYAGGMMICPDAKNNDQLFDICIIKGISRWKLLKIFPSVFKGKHINHPSVTTLKGEKLEVLSNAPMIAHGDGEIIGETPFKVKIAKSTLYVL